jgi:2-dehydropantoate 2-reductase
MKMLVVGAGSVGGYFGGKLAAIGRDVTFLARPGRASQLADGLVIRAEERPQVIPVKVITVGQVTGTYDVIFLAVKAYQLAAAVDDLAPCMNGSTIILPVLNGMQHMDVLRSRFGDSRVIGGVAIIATSLDEHGWILDQGRFHYLGFGEFSGAKTDRLLALEGFLSGADFDTRLSADIEREMWEKWAMLAGLGAITCLMDGDIGEVARAPGGKSIVGRLFGEITETIAASWQPLSPAFKAQTLALLTDEASNQTSSMFRDLKSGHRIEADQIIGDLLARAAARGVLTPLLSAVLVRLKVYEDRLARRPRS